MAHEGHRAEAEARGVDQLSTQDPWGVYADVVLIRSAVNHQGFADPLSPTFEEDITGPLVATLGTVQDTLTTEQADRVGELIDAKLQKVAMARLYKPTAAQFVQAIVEIHRQVVQEVVGE